MFYIRRRFPRSLCVEYWTGYRMRGMRCAHEYYKHGEFYEAVLMCGLIRRSINDIAEDLTHLYHRRIERPLYEMRSIIMQFHKTMYDLLRSVGSV